MEFRILGTLEIRDGAEQLLALPRRKQRLLLAVLLLRANTPVPTESLLDLLWLCGEAATPRIAPLDHIGLDLPDEMLDLRGSRLIEPPRPQCSTIRFQYEP
jgi:hypothetical protein